MSVCLWLTDVTSPNCNAYSGYEATMFTERRIQGARFLRLQWLTFGYSAPLDVHSCIVW